MNDSEAMDWLGRLLDLEPDQRSTVLDRLSIDEPALHMRLVKLLDAALTVESSQALELAVREGISAAVDSSISISLHAQQVVAGYRLLRELGRGGMAAVWLAERTDGLIKRPVALKLPLLSVESPVAVARFLQEKDVLASLAHPHIARVYDAGVVDGRPFIVLEYIDGVAITEYCDSNALDLSGRLRLFLQVLEAVEHAHKRLVVHRDLKPSNILVDAEGQVKLLDFGISKLLVDPAAPSSVAKLTQLGEAVLTPAYAAPEQANGETISTLTDVFVLGVVLHELLSGALPYAGLCGANPTLGSMIDALLRGSPTRPSEATIDDLKARARGTTSALRLRALLKGDLDTITYKALQFEPSRRYGSAERFAADVRRFLASRPIAARRPGVLYSLGLFLRRNRAVSAAACIGAILSLVGATTAVKQYFDARENAESARAVRDFMFEFVNDAEPNESQSIGEITGRQMLDAAVERARSTFADKPQLRGEVLGELGRMYLRFQQPELAGTLLVEALGILEGSAAPDDAALNYARAQLAGALIGQNKLTEARALATLVVNQCRSSACARARYVANTVFANANRFEGKTEESLQAMRRAVEDATVAFGGQHTDTTEAIGTLALMLRNAGHLIEAAATIELAIHQSTGQALRKAERIHLLHSMAAIEVELGRYDSALQRLLQLPSQTDNRRAGALTLRMIATTYLAKGEPQAALDKADAAIQVLPKEHVGVDLLYATQVRAQALALIGREEEALAEIGRVAKGLLQMGRAPKSPEVLRVNRLRAEVLLRSGKAAEALQVLRTSHAQLKALPEARAIELAQTLELLGCAYRELGQPREAVAAHEAAAVELRENLPIDHPFLIRNTLYKRAAANDQARFEQEAKRLKLLFEPSSIWHRIIDARINPSLCHTAPKAVCTLVL